MSKAISSVEDINCIFKKLYYTNLAYVATV